MPGFKASKRLSALDYDFEDFAPEHLRPMRGRIPEPSRAAVIEFNDKMAKGAESLGYDVPDPTDRDHIIKIYANMTTEELYELDGHVLDAIQEVTGNTPPREQLEQIGSRARGVFQEWLQRELNSPEAPASATSR